MLRWIVIGILGERTASSSQSVSMSVYRPFNEEALLLLSCSGLDGSGSEANDDIGVDVGEFSNE